jgi:hypothetical protein
MFSDWLLSCGRPATLDELTRSAIRECVGAEISSVLVRRHGGTHGGCRRVGLVVGW